MKMRIGSASGCQRMSTWSERLGAIEVLNAVGFLRVLHTSDRGLQEFDGSGRRKVTRGSMVTFCQHDPAQQWA
jgi:hypothetical protein